MTLINHYYASLSNNEIDPIIEKINIELNFVKASMNNKEYEVADTVIKLHENSISNIQKKVVDACSRVVTNETAEGCLVTDEIFKKLLSLDKGNHENNLISEYFPQFEFNMPRHIANMLKLAQLRDERIGVGNDLLFHNAHDDEVLKSILMHGSLYSRREAIKADINIPFTQGSSHQKIVMSKEGVSIGDSFTSWNDVGRYSHGKPESMIKHPLGELDQILFEENNIYYPGSWALVFPSREIRKKYEYTKNHDGVHILPKGYDDSNREDELNTGRPNFSSKGCDINLNHENHFLILTTKESSNQWKEYFYNQYPHLPHAEEFSDFHEWYKTYVYEVDDFKDIEAIKKVMFTRFKIETSIGHTIATGNFADSAATSMPVYQYVE